MDAFVKEVDLVTDGKIELTGVPFHKNDHVEVILIKKGFSGKNKRCPAPELSGTRITGNIMDSAIPEEEWGALK